MNLREFAGKLGLSQTTVSRALNGYPEVSERTRQRVREAATRLHYRPNDRALSLATGRTRSIGHIIPISSKGYWVSPIFSDFIAGAGEVYSKNGFDLRLSVVTDRNEESTYREVAMRGSVDGVIVHAPRDPDPRIELLQSIGLPFVVHGRASNQNVDYNWMDVNNKRAFQRATQFLLDLGHRRIGLVNGPETMNFAVRRRLGYQEALQEKGIEPSAEYIYSGEMTEPYGHQAVMEMMKLPLPPTAFLVSSILSAIGVRRAIQEMGLNMGKDISVITHDDDLSYIENSGGVPIFSATKSSVREAGKVCADILLSTIKNPNQPPQHVLFEAQLVIGASTGPAPR